MSEIEPTQPEIENIKATLETLIVWLAQTEGGLGVAEANMLLNKLNGKDDTQS